MRKGTLTVLVLVLALSMVLPSASLTRNEKSGSGLVTAMVIFPNPGTRIDFEDYVERVIAPYDNFVMAELTE